jgi:hypothetical protein
MGELNSWGVYMTAALALLLFLSPALSASARDSREGVDLRNVDGVRAVLSSLQPGVSVRFSFGASASSDPIAVQGHEISSFYGSGYVRASCVCQLPDETLRPAVPYLAYLSGGVVVLQGG